MLHPRLDRDSPCPHARVTRRTFERAAFCKAKRNRISTCVYDASHVQPSARPNEIESATHDVLVGVPYCYSFQANMTVGSLTVIVADPAGIVAYMDVTGRVLAWQAT